MIENLWLLFGRNTQLSMPRYFSLILKTPTTVHYISEYTACVQGAKKVI